jgi:hypothetical protein
MRGKPRKEKLPFLYDDVFFFFLESALFSVISSSQLHHHYWPMFNPVFRHVMCHDIRSDRYTVSLWAAGASSDGL